MSRSAAVPAALREPLAEALRAAGDSGEVRSLTPVGGGCINNAARLETAQSVYCLKWNPAPRPGMFASEARGLALLTATETVRVPAVYGVVEAVEGRPACILLEWLEGSHRPGPDDSARLGEQLAALHLAPQTIPAKSRSAGPREGAAIPAGGDPAASATASGDFDSGNSTAASPGAGHHAPNHPTTGDPASNRSAGQSHPTPSSQNGPAAPASEAPRYGLDHDNYIGSTPQLNTWEPDWARFFAEYRLRPQLELAIRNGRMPTARRRKLEALIERLPALLGGVERRPSLIHGDLWGGNVIPAPTGLALIDPAVSYSDREAEIAYTELFGGFSPRFYAAYQSTWPLDPSYPTRRNLYNLYHLLNHLNLFGEGYGGAVDGVLGA